MTRTTSINNKLLKYTKTLIISSITGILLMILIVAVISLVLEKVDKYESTYPMIAIAVSFIPGFAATRKTTQIITEALLVVALAQTLIVALFMLIFAFAVYKGQVNINDYALSLIYYTASSLAAALIPRRSKKHKRI